VSESCLYVGSVHHRRRSRPRAELRYPLFMAYLDLAELPALFDRHLLWSARRPALAWFRRADHLGEPHTPLRESVRELVLDRTGIVLDGPIRLLTHLRYLGHCFNPVSFYYCFDAAGEDVRVVVAYVTNTPWREHHAYVLPLAEEADRAASAPALQVVRGRFEKALHVSPLMSMQHTYDWRLSKPGERLSVRIDSTQLGGARVFDATLSLARRELNGTELRRVLLRYPALTLRLSARIYAHALRLRLRGARWYAHPARTNAEDGASCPLAPASCARNGPERALLGEEIIPA
jgi:DUF1365 family protein